MLEPQAASASQVFERVRRGLLAAGSLEEAATVTLDHALSHIAASRLESIPALAAEPIAAFPSPQPWAQEIAELPNRLAGRPRTFYRATYDLRRRLRRAPRAAGGRPPLLIPSRALADRLVRGRGEHEDPVGAASGL